MSQTSFPEKLTIAQCPDCGATELYPIKGEDPVLYLSDNPCKPGCDATKLNAGFSLKRADRDHWLLGGTISLDKLATEAFALRLRPEPHPAPAFLEAGAKHMRDRADQRDTPGGERSMAKAVNAFNAMYGYDLSEEQGWQFMVLLKMSRATNGRYVQDDYEDQAAYSGLAGESASRDRTA